MKKLNLKIVASILMLSAFIISCSNDNDEIYSSGEKSDTNFYMTDAPTDNANVKGVIVTVADVKVNGVSIESFSKTTIDLMQYQNGMTKLLGNLELNTGTYSNITLELDNELDANGDAPGSYVLMTDGSIETLQNTSNSININDSFEVLATATNNIVLDFDVRKAIVTEGTSEFVFVSKSELANSIRIINEVKSGEIKGNVNDIESNSDKIIVYAYAKGTFDSSKETKEQGSGVLFANALNSASVNSVTGKYELNFLAEGDYELHYASYKDEDNDGKLEFSTLLEVESVTGLDLNNVSVESSLNINISVNLKV
ncbi:DUF4382 domain-containing protein [Lutibacter sp. TH_r2]|uniref:DUF4382 domain-containing protein n=1 Tax=Lutibacter sp. TH_r2 TaxID=3082083 RepID=UPI002953A537|nr:DUF4382 domain-containing protein [Lutibacter sp. TH_r2]MDV7186606.1 DUF4382 domain-containing protein [Lutibacter sp. TH_r2]